MTIQEHYQRGFMAKMAQAGKSPDDVARIVSELGAQFGSNGLDDNPENDYGSGIADSIRNIWTPSEVMAKKQRRFEKNYKKKGGLGKIWEQVKHPIRSMRADGTAGAMGLTAGAVAYALANAIVINRMAAAEDERHAAWAQEHGLPNLK